ncbi:hypothetical protein LINPERHAP1_LOCUS17435 [Linum perenne]
MLIFNGVSMCSFSSSFCHQNLITCFIYVALRVCSI